MFLGVSEYCNINECGKYLSTTNVTTPIPTPTAPPNNSKYGNVSHTVCPITMLATKICTILCTIEPTVLTATRLICLIFIINAVTLYDIIPAGNEYTMENILPEKIPTSKHLIIKIRIHDLYPKSINATNKTIFENPIFAYGTTGIIGGKAVSISDSISANESIMPVIATRWVEILGNCIKFALLFPNNNYNNFVWKANYLVTNFMY